jgi:Cft2 family RNA processing exonuclease
MHEIDIFWRSKIRHRQLYVGGVWRKRILVDCGLPQGSDEKKLGLELPFRASEIDHVLLTHAHIDHSGRIPFSSATDSGARS